MLEMAFYWSLTFTQFRDVKRKVSTRLVVFDSKQIEFCCRTLWRCSSTTLPPLLC